MENIVGKNALETIISLTSIPMVNSATLSTNTINVGGTPMPMVDITYVTKWKDQVKNKVRTFRKSVTGMMNGKDFVPCSSLFSQELNENVVKMCPSPSGTKIVVLKSITNPNNNKKEYRIEVRKLPSILYFLFFFFFFFFFFVLFFLFFFFFFFFFF